jgi:predicted enzyme related to lactoylglutathione lyase
VADYRSTLDPVRIGVSAGLLGHEMMGPHEVPTGEWIVVATDPAGAAFGLTGPKGE